MKTEELLQLGISKEQADSILAMNGRDIERTKSANREQRLELEKLKEVIKEKEKELDEYRSLNVEEILNEKESWKQKAEQIQANVELIKEQEQLRTAKERLYSECGVKSGEVLDALINWESVSVNAGEAVGLGEQLNAIREKHRYLFEQKSTLPYFSATTEELSDSDGASAVREAMGI